MDPKNDDTNLSDDEDTSFLNLSTEDDFSEIESNTNTNLSNNQKILIEHWKLTSEKIEFPEKIFHHLTVSNNNNEIKQYVELVNSWEKNKQFITQSGIKFLTNYFKK